MWIHSKRTVIAVWGSGSQPRYSASASVRSWSDTAQGTGGREATFNKHGWPAVWGVLTTGSGICVPEGSIPCGIFFEFSWCACTKTLRSSYNSNRNSLAETESCDMLMNIKKHHTLRSTKLWKFLAPCETRCDLIMYLCAESHISHDWYNIDPNRLTRSG